MSFPVKFTFDNILQVARTEIEKPILSQIEQLSKELEEHLADRDKKREIFENLITELLYAREYVELFEQLKTVCDMEPNPNAEKCNVEFEFNPVQYGIDGSICFTLTMKKSEAKNLQEYKDWIKAEKIYKKTTSKLEKLNDDLYKCRRSAVEVKDIILPEILETSSEYVKFKGFIKNKIIEGTKKA